MSPITRRQVLLSAVGLGLGGAGLAAGLLGPDVVRRLTPDDCGPAGPPPPGAGLRITRETVRSKYVSQPVEISTSFPPGHRRERRPRCVFVSPI